VTSWNKIVNDANPNQLKPTSFQLMPSKKPILLETTAGGQAAWQ